MEHIFTKQNFIDAMNYIIDKQEKANKLSMAIQEYSGDKDFSGFFDSSNEVYNILKDVYNDVDDWIGYWLYELDCGRLAKRNSIKIGKKNIPIKTLDDLYNLLIKTNEDRN